MVDQAAPESSTATAASKRPADADISSPKVRQQRRLARWSAIMGAHAVRNRKLREYKMMYGTDEPPDDLAGGDDEARGKDCE